MQLYLHQTVAMRNHNQVVCITYVTGDGKKKRGIEGHIAIALNPQDSDALTMEPHLFDDIQDFLFFFIGPQIGIASLNRM